MHGIEQQKNKAPPILEGRAGGREVRGSLHLECMMKYKLGEVSTVEGSGKAPHSCNEGLGYPDTHNDIRGRAPVHTGIHTQSLYKPHIICNSSPQRGTYT